MQWIWTYPVWVLVLFALFATALTFFFYRGDTQKFEVKRSWIVLLSILRWTSLFLLGLLLVNPLLRYVSNQKVQPTIIILEDHTASIKEGMGASELSEFRLSMDLLTQELSQQFKVVSYGFGTEILDTLNKTSYDELGTDINKAIQQAEQRSMGEHIGAVILSSDGIYNHGINPVYNTSFLGIPLYTIALGDTTAQKDIGIQRVRYNDLVYLGDEVQILVDVVGENFDQQDIQLQLKNARGQVVQQIPLKIKGNEWRETVELRLKAEQEGIHNYRIELTYLSGEKSRANNQQNMYIQVIDDRQRVLLLYDAPHADIKFVRDALEQIENIEIKVKEIGDYQGDIGQEDLLILYGLPSLKNRLYHSQVEKLAQKSKSIWWVVSTQTDLTSLNQLQNLVQVYNVQRTPNDVKPIYQTDFQKFIISEKSVQWLDEVPPLLSPYGQFKLSPHAEVGWTQQIGRVKTSQPLLVSGEEHQKKVAILFGEGLWRWGMQEYAIHEQKNRSFEWIERWVQYIASKSDHRPFRIRTNKTIYNESESISVEAAVYTESTQMVNISDVKLMLLNEKREQQEFLMDKTQNAYTYNVGKLPAGEYKIVGETELANKKLRAEYKFAVQEFDLETNQTKADYETLNTLALNHQSQMLHYSQIGELNDLIQNDERVRPIFKEQLSTKSLLDFKFILFTIIMLLTIEWFIRRFLGQY